MGWAEVLYFIRGIDSFHLNVEHFPASTKEGIPLTEILRLGILPLGTKRRVKWFQTRMYLNVGALNTKLPSLHQEVMRLSKAALGESYGGYRLYKISEQEFLEVMARVYGKNPGEVEAALKLNDHAKKS